MTAPRCDLLSLFAIDVAQCPITNRQSILYHIVTLPGFVYKLEGKETRSGIKYIHKYVKFIKKFVKQETLESDVSFAKYPRYS